MYEFELEVTLPKVTLAQEDAQLRALQILPRVLEVDKELEPEVLTR